MKLTEPPLHTCNNAYFVRAAVCTKSNKKKYALWNTAPTTPVSDAVCHFNQRAKQNMAFQSAVKLLFKHAKFILFLFVCFFASKNLPLYVFALFNVINHCILAPFLLRLCYLFGPPFISVTNVIYLFFSYWCSTKCLKRSLSGQYS